MSSTPPDDRPGTPDPSAEEPAAAPEVELGDVVDRATVRRAPRYRAFFWTGALVGIVVGLVFGLYLLASDDAAGMDKGGVYLTVVVLGTTTFTVLVAGLLAVLADRRSVRRRDRG
ncbi:histidine kinase [Cellulomonas sp. PhB143]|uniref:histidine kinase n=1 Tax=Cellulomonas sp. PhB143 TaxID=2485186 RepID=UPI000F472D0A|nr:histidine kinase [Cellulomonas sp. PhB143]ROS76529.1 hypothetical protein EDF32_1344 [Cellulomonas sp. PhB143]